MTALAHAAGGPRPPGLGSGGSATRSGSGAKGAAAHGRSGSSAKRVSQDEKWWQDRKEEVAEMLDTPQFNVVLSIVILLNILTIGVEQSLEINGQDTLVVKIIESMFLVLYIIELGLRFVPKGMICLRDRWVQFDFVLVVLGILQAWVIEPFVDSSKFGFVMVLRTTRLFRLARTMRLLYKVRACWILIRGFMHSASIMLYSLLLVFLTLYVFACLACEVITKHSLNAIDDTFHAEVTKHWSTLPQIMLTLIRFVSSDNIGDVYEVLVQRDPWLTVYFVALILVVSLVLFHLLGAVIFSSVLEQQLVEQESLKSTKEAEVASLIQDLKKMFLRIDVDNSGTLSRDEIINMDPKDNQTLTHALGVSTPMQVFNTLDVDKTGEVPIAEFVNIIWDVVVKSTTSDARRMEKQVETMDWRVREMFSLQHDLQVKLTKMLQDVEDVKQCLRPDANSHADGHANGRNGHTSGTNGFVASLVNSSARKVSVDSGSTGDKGRMSSKSSSKQCPVEATDELITRLRQTWEESLVFAFEHVTAPISITRNSCSRGVDGLAATKKLAAGLPAPAESLQRRSDSKERSVGDRGSRELATMADSIRSGQSNEVPLAPPSAGLPPRGRAATDEGQQQQPSAAEELAPALPDGEAAAAAARPRASLQPPPASMMVSIMRPSKLQLPASAGVPGGRREL